MSLNSQGLVNQNKYHYSLPMLLIVGLDKPQDLNRLLSKGKPLVQHPGYNLKNAGDGIITLQINWDHKSGIGCFLKNLFQLCPQLQTTCACEEALSITPVRKLPANNFCPIFRA